MNTSLPIYNYKNEIINAVKNHAVTIITAETGSGKSTQVPQYLNEVGYDVVVTEPRRMAAWSLAQRVAEEMDTPLGETVGFRTAFERNDSPNTSILYCTDGLELVRILTDTKDRKKVLVIDEVHEWNLNIETLIAWSKKKITENWCTKVVIMSATLEKESLANYFEKSVYTLEVPGNLYPVSFSQKTSIELIPSIRKMISEGHNTLVFVPGKKEIEKVINELSDEKAVILPLHGELDSFEQRKCFKSYSLPKVIVATNVAQTSITISDIDAVVDTGEERRLEVNDGIQGLFLRSISKADCLQRKGRAGRTKEGRYILCSDTYFEDREEFSVPEIQRGILDQIVLRLATCGIDATQLEFFHQPSEGALIMAKEKLINLGAIEESNNVTSIGYKMAKMPVSVQAARMIVAAEEYGVTEEVICIASILEIGGLLNRETSYSEFTTEESSDLLAELEVWKQLKEMRYIEFDKLGINKKSFYRIKEHIQKMHDALDEIVEITSSEDKRAVKKACLTGMLEYVYKEEYDGYVNGDGIKRVISRESCLYGWNRPRLLVGIPKTIEFDDRMGIRRKLNIISMATKVSTQELMELAPNFFCYKDVEPYYSVSVDAIKVTRKTYFKNMLLEQEEVVIPEHPDYLQLKEEYESNHQDYYENKRQETVIIDGKAFKVHYGYAEASIVVDSYTLYHTDVKNVVLDNGTRVTLKYGDSYFGKSGNSMADLRNKVENERVKRLWDKARKSLPELESSKISSVLKCIPYIGKTNVTYGNGGYGAPIYGFICLSLQNKSLKLELLEDEEKADNKTKEAVEFLYGENIREKYPEKKFKFRKGTKGLSPKEQKVKEEFYSEVRQLLEGLDIRNIEERLSYLDELYDVLVEELKIA